jgi:hypothetical protein
MEKYVKICKIEFCRNRLLETRIIDTIALLKQNLQGRTGRIIEN